MQKTCNKNLEDLLGTKQHKETVDETNLDTEEWQSFTAVAATGDREEKDIVGDRINGILTEEQRERNEDKEYDSKSRPQDWQSLPFLKAEKISRWEKIGKSLTFYLFLFNQEDFNSLTFELIEKIWNKVRWGQLYKGLTSVKTGENLSSSDATIEVDYRPVRYARATTVGLLSNPVGANTDTTGEKLFKERQDMSKADLSQSCLVEFHESAKSYDSDKPANLNTWVRDNAYKNVRRDSIISDNYQSNGKREFVHKRPFSVRGKEYQDVSGEISEEKYQQLQYTEEYLKYQNPGSASNFRPRAGLRDDFKYRFEKAVSDLPARQRQAINLYRFDPDCETWKDVAERIPNREGDGKGVSTKWLRHGIRKPAMETLAKKFPERVGSYVKDPIDSSYIPEEKLAGIPIAFITDQIYKFTCNCSPVGNYEFIKETREMTCPNCGRDMKGKPIEWGRKLAKDPEEEVESDRIKAGFNFGKWPKKHGKLPYYTKREHGHNEKAIDSYGKTRPVHFYLKANGIYYRIDVLNKRELKRATAQPSLSPYRIWESKGKVNGFIMRKKGKPDHKYRQWWLFYQREIKDHPRLSLVCGPHFIFYLYMYALKKRAN